MIFVAAHGDKSPAAPFAASATNDSRTKIAERFGELPLSFEINKGQTDPAVKFVSHGPGHDPFLTANEAVLSLRRLQAPLVDKLQTPGTTVVEGAVLRLKMIGANATSRVEGQEQLSGKVNYFIGNDRKVGRKFRPIARSGTQMSIPELTSCITETSESSSTTLSWRQAPIQNSKVRIEGAERLRLDQAGNLLLVLKNGEVRLNKPFIYQLTDKVVEAK